MKDHRLVLPATWIRPDTRSNLQRISFLIINKNQDPLVRAVPPRIPHRRHVSNQVKTRSGSYSCTVPLTLSPFSLENIYNLSGCFLILFTQILLPPIYP